jgi:hypothetical protein
MYKIFFLIIKLVQDFQGKYSKYNLVSASVGEVIDFTLEEWRENPDYYRQFINDKDIKCNNFW